SSSTLSLHDALPILTSALCSTGRTTWPVKVTSTLRILETMRALPCSTLRNSFETTSRATSTNSRQTPTTAAMPAVAASMGHVLGSSGGNECGGGAVSGPLRAWRDTGGARSRPRGRENGSVVRPERGSGGAVVRHAGHGRVGPVTRRVRQAAPV